MKKSAIFGLSRTDGVTYCDKRLYYKDLGKSLSF